MGNGDKIHGGNVINVTGSLHGRINAVAFNAKVTGTADRSTGHVTNVYHDVDPAIGQELSRMVLSLTIVCAHMALESGAARNLNSIVPMQTLQRLVSFTLRSHKMQCLQTVAWTEPDAAVVTMEFSGTLPPCSGESLPIPDVLSEFRQTGPDTIQQSATTQATFDGDPQPISVEINYTIDGGIPGKTKVSQFLENANNTSSYDETTQKITYNTEVRMLEAQ